VSHAPGMGEVTALCSRLVPHAATALAAAPGAAPAPAPALRAGRAAAGAGAGAVRPHELLSALSRLRQHAGWREPFAPAQWEALVAACVFCGPAGGATHASGEAPDALPTSGADDRMAGRARGDQSELPLTTAPGHDLPTVATLLEAVTRLAAGRAACLAPGPAARVARELLRQAAAALAARPAAPAPAAQEGAALASAATVLHCCALLGAWEPAAFAAVAQAAADALEWQQGRYTLAHESGHAPPPAPPGLPPAAAAAAALQAAAPPITAAVLSKIAFAACRAGLADERLARLLLQAAGGLVAAGARLAPAQLTAICEPAAALPPRAALIPIVQSLFRAALCGGDSGGGGDGARGAVECGAPEDALRRLHALHLWAAAAVPGGAGLGGALPAGLMERCRAAWARRGQRRGEDATESEAGWGCLPSEDDSASLGPCLGLPGAGGARGSSSCESSSGAGDAPPARGGRGCCGSGGSSARGSSPEPPRFESPAEAIRRCQAAAAAMASARAAALAGAGGAPLLWRGPKRPEETGEGRGRLASFPATALPSAKPGSAAGAALLGAPPGQQAGGTPRQPGWCPMWDVRTGGDGGDDEWDGAWDDAPGRVAAGDQQEWEEVGEEWSEEEQAPAAPAVAAGPEDGSAGAAVVPPNAAGANGGAAETGGDGDCSGKAAEAAEAEQWLAHAAAEAPDQAPAADGEGACLQGDCTAGPAADQEAGWRPQQQQAQQQAQQQTQQQQEQQQTQQQAQWQCAMVQPVAYYTPDGACHAAYWAIPYGPAQACQLQGVDASGAAAAASWGVQQGHQIAALRTAGGAGHAAAAQRLARTPPGDQQPQPPTPPAPPPPALLPGGTHAPGQRGQASMARPAAAVAGTAAAMSAALGCPVHVRAQSLGDAPRAPPSFSCHARAASMGLLPAAASCAPGPPQPAPYQRGAGQAEAAAGPIGGACGAPGGADAPAAPSAVAAALTALAAASASGAGGSPKQLRAAAARLGSALFRGLGAAAPADVAACITAWGQLGFVAGPQGLLAECLLVVQAACGRGAAAAGHTAPCLSSLEALGAVVAGLGELAEAASEADGGRLPAPPHLVHGAAAQCCATLASAMAASDGGDASVAGAAAGAALEGAARLRHRLSGGCLAPLAAAVARGCAAARARGGTGCAAAADAALRALQALALLRQVAPRAFSAATLPPPLVEGLAREFAAGLQGATHPGAPCAPRNIEDGGSGGCGGAWGVAEAAAAVAVFDATMHQLAAGWDLWDGAAAERCTERVAAALAAPHAAPPAGAARRAAAAQEQQPEGAAAVPVAAVPADAAGPAAGGSAEAAGGVQAAADRGATP
jgi:hypothetical protein